MRLAVIFLIISLLLIGFDRVGFLAGPKGLVEQALSFRVSLPNFESEELKRLREQNQELLSKLVDQKNLVNENQALRIQLDASKTQTPPLASGGVLPAKVLGGNLSFLIIDKGKSDKVERGQNAVFKNILVGRVVAVSQNRARVELPTSPHSKIPAKTQRNALGIVVGKGGRVSFEDVTLAETLEVGDFVFTVGTISSEQTQESGFLPNLLIGEVQSISKSEGALFQQAQIKSPLDFRSLPEVIFLVL